MEENQCLREVTYNDKMWGEFPLSKNYSHINFLICQSWKKRESFTLWKIGVCLGTIGSYRHSFAFWHLFFYKFFWANQVLPKGKVSSCHYTGSPTTTSPTSVQLPKICPANPSVKRLTMIFFPFSHCITSNPPLLVCLIQLKSNFCIFWMMTSCQNCVTLGLLDQNAIFTQQD